jgi:hypothetical protein
LRNLPGYRRYQVTYFEYENGVTVAEEPHTGYRVEEDSKKEARARMCALLEQWTGDSPDPRDPTRSVEAVLIRTEPVTEPPAWESGESPGPGWHLAPF